jgi:prepilin-type processing-associated H-X9-DG protein
VLKKLEHHIAFTLVELLSVVAVLGVLGAIGFSALPAATAAAQGARCKANLHAIGRGFSVFLADNQNRYPGAGPGNTSPVPPNTGGNWLYLRWPHRVGACMDLGGTVAERDPGNGEKFYSRTACETEPVFRCPATDSAHNKVNSYIGNYGVNGYIVLSVDSSSLNVWGIRESEITSPARTVLVVDRACGDNDPSLAYGGYMCEHGPYPDHRAGPAPNHRADRNPTRSSGSVNVLYADFHVGSIPCEAFRNWKAPASPFTMSPN